MAEYLDLVGLPYERGARGPDTYDCAGVCEEYMRRLGIEVPDGAWKSPSTRFWELLEVDHDRELEPGDVILSLDPVGRMHVDVVLGTDPQRVLTAVEHRGVQVRRSFGIQNRMGAYRLKR